MLCGVSTVYICKPAGYSHTWSNSLKINLKSLSEVLLCAIFSARHWCRGGNREASHTEEVK